MMLEIQVLAWDKYKIFAALKRLNCLFYCHIKIHFYVTDELLSLYAVHPITGAKIPIIISGSTEYPDRCDSRLGKGFQKTVTYI